jgi:hypothetical protein
MYRTDLTAWMLRNLPKWIWSLLQNGSLVFELTAPLLFGVRRTRPLAIFVGSAFHLGIAATMYMLILFSAQVMAFYALFFSEDLSHAIARRLGMRRYARSTPKDE